MKYAFILILLVFQPSALWSQSDSLTLDDAVREAMRNNPEVRAAQKDIDLARARILRAEAYPNTGIAFEADDIPSSLNILDAERAGIRVTQPFEFPGKAGSRGDVERIGERIARERLRQVEAMVTSAVTRLYYKAAWSSTVIANLEAVAELLRRFEETAQMRYEARMSPFLEVLRARVEIAKAANALFEARRTARIDGANLARVLGRAYSATLRVAAELPFVPLAQSEDEYVAAAVGTRASLAIALLRVEQGEAAITVARKSALPDYAVGLAWQHNTGQAPYNANNFAGAAANTLGLSLEITLPLWFRAAPRAEEAAATAELDRARIALDALRRDIAIDVRNAWDMMASAGEQVRTFRTSLLADIEDELQSGLTLYQNNQIDALNLLDIYRTYTESRGEYYRALYNFNIALANLEIAGEDPLHHEISE